MRNRVLRKKKKIVMRKKKNHTQKRGEFLLTGRMMKIARMKKNSKKMNTMMKRAIWLAMMAQTTMMRVAKILIDHYYLFYHSRNYK